MKDRTIFVLCGMCRREQAQSACCNLLLALQPVVFRSKEKQPKCVAHQTDRSSIL